MVCKNNISNGNEKELSVQIFSEAADDIAGCSNELLVVAEAIAQSCLLIGTMSEDCREVLSSRAKDFEKLAGLFKTRSSRFEDIAKRLTGGMQEEAVLVENAC